MVDLILRGGRVIDPSQDIDQIADVAFANGVVAGIGPAGSPGLVTGPATVERDVSGKIVTPGLIDLHTHVYWGGTSIGIDAAALCREQSARHHGSVDTGSAGAGQFHRAFRAHVIDPSSAVRILVYLHVSLCRDLCASGRNVHGRRK